MKLADYLFPSHSIKKKKTPLLPILQRTLHQFKRLFQTHPVFALPHVWHSWLHVHTQSADTSYWPAPCSSCTWQRGDRKTWVGNEMNWSDEIQWCVEQVKRSFLEDLHFPNPHRSIRLLLGNMAAEAFLQVIWFQLMSDPLTKELFLGEHAAEAWVKLYLPFVCFSSASPPPECSFSLKRETELQWEVCTRDNGQTAHTCAMKQHGLTGVDAPVGLQPT